MESYSASSVTTDPAATAVTAATGIVALRLKYADLREAKALIAAGRIDDAVRLINGPNSEYIRGGLSGTNDRRIKTALRLANVRLAQSATYAAAEPLKSDTTPEPVVPPVTLTVTKDIADAFGMADLPSTVVIDTPEPVEVKRVEPVTEPAPATPEQSTEPETTADQSTEPTAAPSTGRFTVGRSEFLAAVKAASFIVPTRCPKPILSCLHLYSDAGCLYIVSTDLERIVRIRIESRIDIQEPVNLILPADKLVTALGGSSDTVELRVEGAEAILFSGTSSMKIFTFSPHEFPLLPSLTPMPYATLHADRWLTATERAVQFTSKEGTRYAFNGTLLTSNGEIVATDGRRLFLQPAGCETNPDKPLIVQARDLKLIRKMLGSKAKGRIIVHTSEQPTDMQRLIFTLPDGNTELITLPIDGQFPPYEDIIPREDEDTKTWQFNSIDLLAAIEEGARSCCESTKGVRMEFDGVTRIVRLTSRNPESGESEARIMATACNGISLTIGFNPDFLGEFVKLAAKAKSTIRLAMTAANRPGLLTFTDPTTRADIQYVLMPVNLQ